VGRRRHHLAVDRHLDEVVHRLEHRASAETRFLA
jgi:hypothetical protein